MKVVYSKAMLKKVIASLCLFSFSLVVACALFSFHPDDPSWFFARSGSQVIKNVLGSIGANAAALLFFLFGSAALLLIPFFFFISYVFLCDEWKEEWDRLIAAVCGIFICSMVGASYKTAIVPHSFPAGGQIGSFLYKQLVGVTDTLVAALFLHVALFITLIILSRLSLSIVVSKIIYYARFALSYDFVVKPFFNAVYIVVAAVWRPCAFLLTHAYNLLNSHYVEKKYKGSSLDFQQIVQQEVSDVVEDPIWGTFNQKSLMQFDQDMQHTTMNPQEDEKLYTFEYDYTEPVKKEPVKQVVKNSREIPYQLPPLDLFKQDAKRFGDPSVRQEHEAMAKILEEKLARFGIQGTVVGIKAGPVITLFEYQPHIDSKISKIIALEDDLALALQATSIRIIAPIPGTSVVGFEVANKVRSDVLFSTIVHSKEFVNFAGRLPLVLGVDTTGNTMIVDLTAMPHVLIAGSTGSGKSVAMNVILMSLLCRCKPDDLKLILIDPKRLEFAPYGDIPHLLFPIVTHPKDAAPVLQWVITTMEARYEVMAECGVRNIFDYNKVAQADEGLEHMPFIVVMIDELSDLMMVAGKEIEEKIARIAQMARAAGIHLIVATQRPSVDVITGIIKANFPSRISFKIATKIDSRTILDTVGADKLLGKGDMLYLDSASRLVRAHGAYVSDQEIEQVADHVRGMQKVCYLDIGELKEKKEGQLPEADEQLYQEVLQYLNTVDEISISSLQRRFRIGFNRSARIIDMLEAQGMILPSMGGKTRKVIRS